MHLRRASSIAKCTWVPLIVYGRRSPLRVDCVEKLGFGGAIAWFVMKAEVVVAALGPLDRGRQLRHWDELGELPEVLSGGGEEEFILGRPWDLVTASDRASGCI